MTRLVEVFGELLRGFGHAAHYDVGLADPNGTAYQVPLLLERDARRTLVFDVVRKEPLTRNDLQAFAAIVKDTGSDAGLVLSVAPAPDQLQTEAVGLGLTLWNAQRITQELGEAVLAETCPDAWTRADPLLAPRPSRVLAHMQEAAAREAPGRATQQATLPEAAPQAPTQLEVPLAFGVLDAAAEPTPPPAAAPPAPRAKNQKQVLKSHVSKTLVLSLVKNKIRNVDKVFLRLVPYHLFDYEAQLLVDGSLDGQARSGRVAVDAAQKRIVAWTRALETEDLNAEGSEVDEKKIRIAEADAAALVRAELVKTVTRDVVMEEDADEWSVTVKKKVSLDPKDVALKPLGLHWAPIWRVSGREGSIEVDATTGEAVHEEMTEEPADAQLI